MSVITRGAHPKALWPGVKRWWGITYNRHEPIWPQMFESLTSTQAYEEDVESVGYGLASVKNETGGVVYDTAHQGTVSRYTHVTYGLGFQVSQEEAEDNLYEKLAFRRADKLARSMSETEEHVHANVFNRAFNASYTGGDGVEMISTAHPTDNGNQSNELTTAADLSEAAIEDLLIQIMDATDARGIKFSNKPRALLVPNALWHEANRIVKSVLQNDSANNAVNVIKMLNEFPDGIIRNPYFTDSDVWFVRTDCMEGLTHYTRRATSFDTDSDFDTGVFKHKSTMRFSAGWSNFRGVYGTPGA